MNLIKVKHHLRIDDFSSGYTKIKIGSPEEGPFVAIHYICRHCHQNIGTIDAVEVEEQKLGFQALTNEERLEMIEYDKNGDMKVKVICETCQEALERNPLFHQLDSFIQ